MRKIGKLLSLILVLALFALMAMGSEESDSRDAKTPSSEGSIAGEAKTQSPEPIIEERDEKGNLITYQVYFKIRSDDNLMFSQYDIDLSLDGNKVGTVANGKYFTFLAELSKGRHTILATNAENGVCPFKNPLAFKSSMFLSKVRLA